MDGLIVGIDLCDTYTQVLSTDEDQAWTLPTVICRRRTGDEWYIGKDAYAHTLQGDGILVDKLVTLAKKDGTATLADVRYEAKELLFRFLSMALELPVKQHGNAAVTGLAFAVRKLDEKLIRLLGEFAARAGVAAEHTRVISHGEAFVYYATSQKKDIWSGTVGMFDLSEEGLRYYELKAQRGLKKMSVISEYEDMDESFSLNILDNQSGMRLADKILCACADRMMQRKVYSSLFLCGKGFGDLGWAEDFRKKLNNCRRVYSEQAVFARGAAYRAADLTREKTAYPFTCVCDGRLRTTVSLQVLHRGQETTVTLACAGDSWYDRRAVVDVIPERESAIDLILTPFDMKKKRTVSIPLEGFPDRTDRTMKLRVLVTFLDGRTMDVRVKDLGFGELFPSSGAQIRQEVMI